MAQVKSVTIVGWSNSGKTTLLTKVVSFLTERGVSVGVVKHHGHRQEMVDTEGKDTWKYTMAGANPVILSSAKQYAVYKYMPQREATRDELIAEIADEVDMVIVEGFRSDADGAVEVSRMARTTDPKLTDEERIALVSDNPELMDHVRAQGKPVFDINDVEGVARYFCQLCDIELPQA